MKTEHTLGELVSIIDLPNTRFSILPHDWRLQMSSLCSKQERKLSDYAIIGLISIMLCSTTLPSRLVSIYFQQSKICINSRIKKIKAHYENKHTKILVGLG